MRNDQTEADVQKSIQCMASKKASGADGISVKILKEASSAISLPLSELINHCIDNGCVPSAWKLAKVIPIYKGKGSREDMLSSNFSASFIIKSL